MKLQLILLGLFLCVSVSNGAAGPPDTATSGDATADAGTSATLPDNSSPDAAQDETNDQTGTTAGKVDVPNKASAADKSTSAPVGQAAFDGSASAPDTVILPGNGRNGHPTSSSAPPVTAGSTSPPKTTTDTTTTTTQPTSTDSTTTSSTTSSTTPKPTTKKATPKPTPTPSKINTTTATTPKTTPVTSKPATGTTLLKPADQPTAQITSSDNGAGPAGVNLFLPESLLQKVVEEAPKSKPKVPIVPRAASDPVSPDTSTDTTTDTTTLPATESTAASTSTSTESTSSSTTNSTSSGTTVSPAGTEGSSSNETTLMPGFIPTAERTSSVGTSEETTTTTLETTTDTTTDTTSSTTTQTTTEQEPVMKLPKDEAGFQTTSPDWTETTIGESTTATEAAATTTGNYSEVFQTRTQLKTEQQKKEDQDDLRLKIALGVVIPVFALLFIAGIIALMKHRSEKGVTVLVDHEEGTITYPKPAILIR